MARVPAALLAGDALSAAGGTAALARAEAADGLVAPAVGAPGDPSPRPSGQEGAAPAHGQAGAAPCGEETLEASPEPLTPTPSPPSGGPA